jgi:hypothetical protein
MWTLILVTFVVSGAATGGVGKLVLGKWERVPISLRRRSTASSPNALRADLSPKP